MGSRSLRRDTGGRRKVAPAARGFGVMSEYELMLVQAGVWRLGLACDEQTPREELVARLWARKRSLSLAIQPA